MFLKYPSIENTYRQKEIQRWLNRFPNLESETFVAQEKIHGSNIQIAIDPNGSWQVFSRKQKINQGDRFQGVDVYGLIEDEYHLVVEAGAKMARSSGEIFRFYGELFGPRIQKGVDYGNTIRILFFDAAINDNFMPGIVLGDFFENKGLSPEKHLVPTVGVYSSLGEALSADIRKDSLVSEKENNIMEGVVIKPYHQVFSSPQGSIFYLKKKNDEFKEKQMVKKEPQDNSVVSGLNLEFMSYLTDQRLQNIFSKYGEIQEPSQIGDYIKYMLEDAKEDFCKDFEEDLVQLDKKELKKVYNAGSRIANMLKGYL
jgi:hypothetical protein